MGGGGLIWLRERPANFSTSAAGAERVVAAAKLAAQSVGLAWCEKNYLLLRRGPYVIASGLDESIAGEPRCSRCFQGRVCYTYFAISRTILGMSNFMLDVE